MKPLTKIFLAIRSLPEEWRRFLVLLTTVFTAIFIFWAWGAVISSNLVPIQNYSLGIISQREIEKSYIEETKPLSPKESMAEIFESLKQLFK